MPFATYLGSRLSLNWLKQALPVPVALALLNSEKSVYRRKKTCPEFGRSIIKTGRVQPRDNSRVGVSSRQPSSSTMIAPPKPLGERPVNKKRAADDILRWKIAPCP